MQCSVEAFTSALCFVFLCLFFLFSVAVVAVLWFVPVRPRLWPQGALELAKQPDMKGKTIVVVIPSFGERSALENKKTLYSTNKGEKTKHNAMSTWRTLIKAGRIFLYALHAPRVSG